LLTKSTIVLIAVWILEVQSCFVRRSTTDHQLLTINPPIYARNVDCAYVLHSLRRLLWFRGNDGLRLESLLDKGSLLDFETTYGVIRSSRDIPAEDVVRRVGWINLSNLLSSVGAIAMEL